MCQHPLWGEDSVKLVYMAELVSRKHSWGSKAMLRDSSGIKSSDLMNQSLKSLGQIGGSMCDEELVKELQSSVLHQP